MNFFKKVMLQQILSLKEICAQMKQNGLIIIQIMEHIQFLLIKNLTKILKSMKNFAKLKKIVPGPMKIYRIINTVVVFILGLKKFLK